LAQLPFRTIAKLENLVYNKKADSSLLDTLRTALIVPNCEIILTKYGEIIYYFNLSSSPFNFKILQIDNQNYSVQLKKEISYRIESEIAKSDSRFTSNFDSFSN